MSCNNTSCGCGEQKPCRAPANSQLGDLHWLLGKTEDGCERYQTVEQFTAELFEQFTEIFCAAEVSPLPPTHVFGVDTMGNCPVKFTPAQLLAGLEVGDSPSVDLDFTGGIITANVIPQWVRDLFSAVDTQYVDMNYDPATGQFSAVIDPNEVVADGLCDVIAGLTVGASAAYGATRFLGSDCNLHTIPAQTLVFNPATRELTISDGNTVIVPDLHITAFSIVGQIATITRSDGQVFQATIPMTIDINVDTFTLNGGVLTITETDGTVHNITLPEDCCPTALQVIGNTVSLTLSNGTVLSAPLPPEVTVSGLSVAGNVLTLTESDGGTTTVTLPSVNVTSADGSVSVTQSVAGTVRTFDLSVNFPPQLPPACADVIACLTEGRNIDIQSDGTISAGYLRDNGDGTYTWINQDGSAVFNVVLPIIPDYVDCTGAPILDGDALVRCPTATTPLVKLDNVLGDDGQWHSVPDAAACAQPARVRGVDAAGSVLDYSWTELQRYTVHAKTRSGALDYIGQINTTMPNTVVRSATVVVNNPSQCHPLNVAVFAGLKVTIREFGTPDLRTVFAYGRVSLYEGATYISSPFVFDISENGLGQTGRGSERSAPTMRTIPAGGSATYRADSEYGIVIGGIKELSLSGLEVAVIAHN